MTETASRCVGPVEDPDRFRLLEPAGSAQGAALWHARPADDADGTRVLVQEIRVASSDTRISAHRCSLLASIRHPGVARVRETFTNEDSNDESTVYLVLAAVDGTPFRDLLWMPDAVAPPELMNHLEQVAATLDAMHSGGASGGAGSVVHGNVDIESIVVTPGGQAVMVGFGFAGPQLGVGADRNAFGLLVLGALAGTTSSDGSSSQGELRERWAGLLSPWAPLDRVMSIFGPDLAGQDSCVSWLRLVRGLVPSSGRAVSFAPVTPIVAEPPGVAVGSGASRPPPPSAATGNVANTVAQPRRGRIPQHREWLVAASLLGALALLAGGLLVWRDLGRSHASASSTTALPQFGQQPSIDFAFGTPIDTFKQVVLINSDTPRVVGSRSTVTLMVDAVYAASGAQLINTFGGQPIVVSLADTTVLQGLVQGLIGAHVGCRLRLLVPSSLARGRLGDLDANGNALVLVVDVIEVSESPVSTTTEATTTAPPTVGGDPEDAAHRELERLRLADRSTLLALAGQWVPQLSAKYFGLEPDHQPPAYNYQMMLQDYHATGDVPGALLASTDDFNLVNGSPLQWYVTLVPVGFGTKAEAGQWCVSHGFSLGHTCLAKQIFPRP